jgi:hypothetical protein
MPLHELLSDAVNFAFVLGIKVSRRSGGRSILPEPRRRGWVGWIHIGCGAAGINNPLQPGRCSSAEEIRRSLDVDFPVPLEVVDRIELPGKVETCVDSPPLEKFHEYLPRGGHIKLEKVRLTSDFPHAATNVEPKDVLTIRVGTQPAYK